MLAMTTIDLFNSFNMKKNKKTLDIKKPFCIFVKKVYVWRECYTKEDNK
jgi:hypothetical protein